MAQDFLDLFGQMGGTTLVSGQPGTSSPTNPPTDPPTDPTEPPPAEGLYRLPPCRDIRVHALNLSRRQVWGNATLRLLQMTPDGARLLSELQTNWTAFTQRNPVTEESPVHEWRFQILAATSEVTRNVLNRTALLQIGDRWWKVTRVIEATGLSSLWEFRAEITEYEAAS